MKTTEIDSNRDDIALDSRILNIILDKDNIQLKCSQASCSGK